VNDDWQPRTYTFSGAPTHGYYRVVVHLTWYHPGASTTDGIATHQVSVYRITGAGSPFKYMLCPNSILP